MTYLQQKWAENTLFAPDQECHLFLGIYFRKRKGQNYDLGF